MAKVIVLGAGLMGRALAYDFCRQPLVKEVAVFDLCEENLAEAEKLVNSPRAKFAKLDIQDRQALANVLDRATLAISGVDYQYNAQITETCIDKGVHFLDLGGCDEIVNQQFEMNERARQQDVAVFPDCGLAPGIAGIFATHIFRQFDSCSSLHMRVGGLPQNPRPPLNYMIVFSVHGLLMEYIEPVWILENGKPKTVPALSGVEKIPFQKFGDLEAFYTAGGISMLVKTLADKVGFLDYKTIRYPGHRAKIKFLAEMGFFDQNPTRFGITPKDMSEEILRKTLKIKDSDVTLLRVWGEGTINGKKVRKTFECVDYQDHETGLTSMMRTTAFPTAIIGGMVLSGAISRRGVLRQEEFVPVADLLKELNRRNVKITEHHTDLVF